MAPQKDKINKPNLIIAKLSLTLDCGKCGGRHYAVKVLTQGNRGKIIGLQCVKCENILRIDNRGWIEGEGVQNLNPPKLITGVPTNVQ